MSAAKKGGCVRRCDQDFVWVFRGFDQVAIYLSLDYRILEVTKLSEALFGTLRKKVLGRSITSLFSLLDLQIAFSKKTNQPKINAISKECQLTHKAQKICHLTWKIKPKLTPDGEPEGYIMYVEKQDDVEYLAQVYKLITGRHKDTYGSISDYAEDIKDYLENIIANLPGNIYWMDKNCIYLGCNNNAARFAGLGSRQEAVGLSYEDMERKAGWVAGHTASWKRDDMEVIKTGKPKLNVEEKPVLQPNGKELFYLTSRVPLFDKKKKVVGVLGVSIDITDRKVMERELAIARERADKAERAVGEKVHQETSRFMGMLAGSIAHALRTPLAIIGINADLLISSPRLANTKGEEKATFVKRFGAINHAIKLATHTIDDMLVMLRTLSSGGQIKNEFEILSILDDINQTIANYPFLEHENSLLEVKLGRVKDFAYCGERMLTQHILANLIRNALYAIKEAEKGKMVIKLGVEGKRNILQFVDTAIGIPEHEVMGVFERFVSKKHGGAGLGLAFCKMVMLFYGGDIVCRSKPGEYTEFTLYFPKLGSSS